MRSFGGPGHQTRRTGAQLWPIFLHLTRISIGMLGSCARGSGGGLIASRSQGDKLKRSKFALPNPLLEPTAYKRGGSAASRWAD
jgi:hypothetical protein